MAGVDDMIALCASTAEQTQQEILENLHARYTAGLSYTNCGPTLVAVNLLGSMSNTSFDQSSRRLYWGDEETPHIFRLGKQAFDRMWLEHKNQAIVVTGESGAGKTYNTKNLLRFLDSKPGCDNIEELNLRSSSIAEQSAGLAQLLIKTSPILEAFGNAVMERNDDSSRFGRLYKMYFDKCSREMSGCQITPYLLEKSRVTRQATNERNFHIFYRMKHYIEVGESSDQDYDQYKNSWAIAGRFQYLSGGWEHPKTDQQVAWESDVLEKRSLTKLKDAKDFEETVQALIEFTEDETTVDLILNIMAGILHLGQINIVEDEYNPEFECDLQDIENGPNVQQQLEIAARLLQMNPENIRNACIKNSILVGGKRLESNPDAEGGRRQRDAMARQIYDAVFNSLVNCMNQRLAASMDEESDLFLAVLDIFGFEFTEHPDLQSGSVNSFEQFCINMCNEQLQERFMAVAIESEKNLIEHELPHEILDLGDFEGYDYTVLAVMQGCSQPRDSKDHPSYFERGANVMSLLNDASKGDRGSLEVKQERLVSTVENLILKQQGKKTPLARFAKGAYKRDTGRAFQLGHYAANVIYDLDGWVAKNKDKVTHEVETCLRLTADMVILSPAFQDSLAGQTLVAADFKNKLSDLTEVLRACSLRFVRCLKAKGKTDQGMWESDFNSELVAKQLKYTGMYQALTVSKSSYEFKMTHSNFVSKYLPAIQLHAAQVDCDQSHNPERSQFQMPTFYTLEQSVTRYNEFTQTSELKVGTTMILGRGSDVFEILKCYREEYQARMQIDLDAWRQNCAEAARMKLRQGILDYVRDSREKARAAAAAAAQRAQEAARKPMAAPCCLALEGDFDQMMKSADSQDEFMARFRADLAQELGIDESRIMLTGLSSGSILVDFTVDSNPDEPDDTGERIRDLIKQRLQESNSMQLGGCQVNQQKSMGVIEDNPGALVQRLQASKQNSDLRRRIEKLEKSLLGNIQPGALVSRLGNLERQLVGEEKEGLCLERIQVVEKAWRAKKKALAHGRIELIEEDTSKDSKKLPPPMRQLCIVPTSAGHMANLYEFCARGQTHQISKFIRKHEVSRVLPTDCLMASIYSLEMEAVNFLIHSGLVDPTIPGRVPMRKAVKQNPPSLETVTETMLISVNVRFNGVVDPLPASKNDTILELKQRINLNRAQLNRKHVPVQAMILTNNGVSMADHTRVHEYIDKNSDHINLKLGKKHGTFSDDLVPYAEIPEFRRLDDDYLCADHLPYDLASKMLRRCRKTKKKEEIEACTFLKAWFKPAQEGDHLPEPQQGNHLTKPDMDWKVVKEALASTKLFEDEREIYEHFDNAIKTLFDTLYPSKPSHEEGGVIAPEILLELMEDLGHDYTLEEIESTLPLDQIDINVFRAVMTSIYMRALNRWCPVKDGINLPLEDEEEAKQFQADHIPQSPKAHSRLEAVLFDIGIETRSSDVQQEIATLVSNEDARVQDDPRKLLFGDFCVLATRLIVKARGNTCSRCIQHCGYKIAACYESTAFILFKYLLLILFCLLAVGCCVFAYEKIDDSTSFQRMITNWETVPLIDIEFKTAVTTVTGTTTTIETPACDSGWETAPSLTWPGSSGPCYCPSSSLYTSTTGTCSATQLGSGCEDKASDAVSGVSVTSGVGTICFLRGGAPCATWDSDKYTERPMLSASASSSTIAATCPSSHTQCGDGYYADNAMCQASGVTCPIRRMTVFKDESTWPTYSAQGYTNYTSISSSGVSATSERLIAWDNPDSTVSAAARPAAELDTSLSSKCSDGTSMTYSGPSSVSSTGSTSNSYTSNSCTLSSEWFTVDTVNESTVLYNAINTAPVCTNEGSIIAVRRSDEPINDVEEPPPEWRELMECPTSDSKVEDLNADHAGTGEGEWVTDASGTTCKMKFRPPPMPSPEQKAGKPPHLWPMPQSRRKHLTQLRESNSEEPKAFLNGEYLSAKTVARRLLTSTCDADSTCTTKADIIFVMDGSGSVGQSSYNTMLDFANLVIEQLTIGPSDTQVGFLVYSLTPTYSNRLRRRRVWSGYDSYYSQWHFNLGDYTDKTTMKDAVGNSPYPGSMTYTGEAIRMAYEELTTVVDGGSRAPSSGVAKIMIVLTDGYATDFWSWADSTDTSYCGCSATSSGYCSTASGTSYATVAKAGGVSLFALGVSGYDANQITGIASSPSSTYARTEGAFSALIATDFVTTLKDSICTTAAPVTSDVAVSTECCALDTYTYYQFTAPGGSSARSITVNLVSGGIQLEYNGASNVASVSDASNPDQATSYTVCSGSSSTTSSDANGAGTCVSDTSFSWTPACTTGDNCVMWIRTKCTAASTNFSVTQTDDNTPPVIVTYNPAQASTSYDASGSADIVMTFSEAIMKAPINADYCDWSITPVTAGAAVSYFLSNGEDAAVTYGDGNTITLVCNSNANFDLDPGIEYQVQLISNRNSSCVTDLSSVAFAGLAAGDYKFSTIDTTAPEIVESSPVRGALGVAASDNIELTFSTPIRLNSGTPTDLSITFTQQAIPTNSPTTTPAQTMTCKIYDSGASQLQPTPAPSPTTGYYTATGDTDQTLCRVTITNSATEGLLSINFADPSPNPGFYDDATTKYAVTMDAYLVENLYCGTSGACSDSSRSTGQPILHGSTNAQFSTHDVTAPSITAYSPLQQAENVASTSGITLTFSEVVELSSTTSLLTVTLYSWTGSGSVYTTEDTTDRRTVVMDTSMLPGSTNTLTITNANLGGALIGGRRYSMDLQASSITDTGATDLISGLCGTCQQYRFTVADVTAPAIINYAPCLVSSGDLAACTAATGVSIGTNIEFTFKDAGSQVSLVDGQTIQLYEGQGTKLLETITVDGSTSTFYSLSQSTEGYSCTALCTTSTGCCETANSDAFQAILTVHFSTELIGSSTYSVALGGVVVDTSGNSFAGLTAGSYYFTTGDTIKPYITAYSPVNYITTVDPATTTSITLTFNEAISVQSSCVVPCISIAQKSQRWSITFATARYTNPSGSVASVSTACAAPTGTGKTLYTLYPGMKLYSSSGADSATTTYQAEVVTYPSTNQNGDLDYCSVTVESVSSGWATGQLIRGNLMTLTVDTTGTSASNMWGNNGVPLITDNIYFPKSGLSTKVAALLTPGSVSMSSTTSTSTVTGTNTVFGSAFEANDVIVIKGAGTSGADLVTQVSAITSDTSLTVTGTCATTVTSVPYGPQKFDVVMSASVYQTCTKKSCCRSAALDGYVSTTASSTTLTGQDTYFTSLTVGDEIVIPGAGASGSDLSTTVASITSSTQLTLTTAASTAVAKMKYYRGPTYSSDCPLYDNYPSGTVTVQMTVGGNTISAATGTVDFSTQFAVDDLITVYGAGASGADLVTKITAVTSTLITVETAASTAVSAASYSGDQGETVEFLSSGAYGRFQDIRRSRNNVGDFDTGAQVVNWMLAAGTVTMAGGTTVTGTSTTFTSDFAVDEQITIVGCNGGADLTSTIASITSDTSMELAATGTCTGQLIGSSRLPLRGSGAFDFTKDVNTASEVSVSGSTMTITLGSATDAAAGNLLGFNSEYVVYMQNTAVQDASSLTFDGIPFNYSFSTTPYDPAPTPAPTTATTGTCASGDTLCTTYNGRSSCSDAEAFATGTTQDFYLQYSREAQWTPECKWTKDSVYKRRTHDQRSEEDWSTQLLSVHSVMVIVLLAAGLVLELYNYHKLRGTYCYPPWVVHSTRLVGILLATLLLFYACLIAGYMYEEWQYYETVLSEGCTAGDYVVYFQAMEDSLKDIFYYDVGVVVMDVLIVIWFLTLLCCLNAKIQRRYVQGSGCWKPDLPEYESAGNGLSERYADWDAHLPEETGCPCANAFCCGCSCCKMNPEGPRIDLDVLGARRRMYMPADSTVVDVEERVDDTQSMGVLLQGAHPVLIPAATLPPITRSNEIMDAMEMGPTISFLEMSGLKDDMLILGHDHATVTLASLPTWHVTDDSTISASHCSHFDGPTTALFEDLKDMLTSDSLQALDEAFKRADGGVITTNLELDLDGDNVGNCNNSKKKRRKKKQTSKLLDGGYDMFSPDGKTEMMRTLMDLVDKGEFDNFMESHGFTDDIIVQLTQPTDQEAEDVGRHNRNRRNRKPKHALFEGIIDGQLESWDETGDRTVFSFNRVQLSDELGLMMHALDSEIRNTLKDKAGPEMESKFLDDQELLQDDGPPLSDVYNSLTADSQDIMIGAVRELAINGEFDEMLRKMMMSDDIMVQIDQRLNPTDSETEDVGRGTSNRRRKRHVVEALFDPQILDSLDQLLSNNQRTIMDQVVRMKLRGLNLDLEEKRRTLGDMIDFETADLQDLSRLLDPLSQVEQDRVRREIENMIAKGNIPLPELVEDDLDFENIRDVQAYLAKLSGDVKVAVGNKIKSDMDMLRKIAQGVPGDFQVEDILAVLGLDPDHLVEMQSDPAGRKRVETLGPALYDQYWLADLRDFVEDKVRENGRKLQLQDVLGVLGFAPCTLTDEYKCEVERFLRPCLVEKMRHFEIESNDTVPSKIVVDIAPVLGFKSDELHNFSFHNSHSYIVQQKSADHKDDPVMMFQICPQTNSTDSVSDNEIVCLKDVPGLSFDTLQDFEFTLKHLLTDDSYNFVLDAIEASMDALLDALPAEVDELTTDREDENVGHQQSKKRPRKPHHIRGVLGFVPSNLTNTCMDDLNDRLRDTLKDILGDLDVQLQSHGNSIVDANITAAQELGFDKMSDLLGKQLSDFLTEDSQLEFDRKINELVHLQEDFRASSQSPPAMSDFTLMFITPDDKVLYALCNLSVDPSIGLDGEYLPVVNCRLFPRPIWVDVQSGPVLLTFRESTLERGYQGEAVKFTGADTVIFSNDKAREITQVAPVYELFASDDHSRETSCMDATLCVGRKHGPEQSQAIDQAIHTLSEQYMEAGSTGHHTPISEEYDTLDFPFQRFEKNMTTGEFLPTGDIQERKARVSPLWSGPVAEYSQYLNISNYNDALCGMLIDCSGAIIIATDERGRVVDMNDQGVYFLASVTGDFPSDSLDCLNRHYSRYVDKVNRQEITRAFKKVMENSQRVNVKNNITLVSNDFTFEMGAMSDLVARVTMYPRFDKYGQVCGVVFEATNISTERLLADMYAHVLSHHSDPLEYNDEEVQDMYVTESADLRQHHAPILAIEYNTLQPDSVIIAECTHAAMLQLNVDPTRVEDRIVGESFLDFLHPDSRSNFMNLWHDVLRKREPFQADFVVRKGDSFQAKTLTLLPWYDENAHITGVIVSFEGPLSGFSLDSDGYVTDCTDAAAAQLGYDKQDIFGKALVTFVDDGSLMMMGDSIMDIMDEEWDELPSIHEIPDQVCQVTMIRQSGRMVQTTWDMTRIGGSNPTKKYAMVVMHKEKWLGVRGRERVRRKDPRADEHVSPREKVELTALEKAEQETEPVRFHYVVMQKDNDITESCSFADFRVYLRVMASAQNPPEHRPWPLHRLNCFLRKPMESKFKEISGGEVSSTFNFQQWENWWNSDERRREWDGGPAMKDGVQLATDFD
jgi:PAS domain-containing protein